MTACELFRDGTTPISAMCPKLPIPKSVCHQVRLKVEGWAPAMAPGHSTTWIYRNPQGLGFVQFRNCTVLDRHDFRTATSFCNETVKCCARADRRYCCGGLEFQKRNYFCSIDLLINSHRIPQHRHPVLHRTLGSRHARLSELQLLFPMTQSSQKNQLVPRCPVSAARHWAYQRSPFQFQSSGGTDGPVTVLISLRQRPG
jgi:hypothetical protein